MDRTGWYHLTHNLKSLKEEPVSAEIGNIQDQPGSKILPKNNMRNQILIQPLNRTTTLQEI